jgi:REP element-mobilizing transposase RayT
MKNRIRLLKKGATYHVICKINRDEIIFDNDLIVNLLYDVVERCKKKYTFTIDPFNIMGNHLHFMIYPKGNASLPRIMQWMNSVFAKAYNKKMGISGKLWKERYYSVIIETKAQFENTFTYILKNPAAAKLVKRARDYRYSGLYHYLNKIEGIIDIRGGFIRMLYERCRFL